jgi:DNA (cytosine-5)-methyltransferase 1
MRFVDLFSGMGGFHLAAEKIGGECVFASEIDEDLRSLYRANFGILPAGDIHHVDPADVPNHDLLCAGFPCQPFSKAGEQKGWRDAKRGKVFLKVLAILAHRMPEYVLLENVPHFVRHDKGNSFAKVKDGLESLGYEVRSSLLSPHQFGVPQMRERLYLVARKGGLGNFTWPAPTTTGRELSLTDLLDKKPKEAHAISNNVLECLTTWQEFLGRVPSRMEIPSHPIWSMEFKATYPFKYNDSLFEVPLSQLRNRRGSFGRTLNAYFLRDILPRVPSHARAESGAFPVWKKHFIGSNRAFYRIHKTWIDKWLPRIERFPSSLQKCEWNCRGEEPDIWRYLIQFRASGVRIRRPNMSPSLVAMTATQVPIVGWERRYMTVRECARLQSMGELKHLPVLGESSASALGNAVNVTVAKAILENLLASTTKAKTVACAAA